MSFLKMMREDTNLSMKELSELSKIPVSTISGYEAGKVAPSLTKAYKLSKVLSEYFPRTVDSILGQWATYDIRTENERKKK